MNFMTSCDYKLFVLHPVKVKFRQRLNIRRSKVNMVAIHLFL
jgi:hypothetical protein